MSARGALAEAREARRDATARLFDGLAAAEADRDLDLESLHFAEELARVPWSMGERERLSLALIAIATLTTTRGGSTRLPIGGGTSGVLGRLLRDLGASAAIDLDVGRALADIRAMARSVSLDRIVGLPGERLPLICADDCIYLQRHHAAEMRLIDRMAAQLAQPPRFEPTAVAEAIADVCDRPSMRGELELVLSDEQRAAVELAARAPLAIVSGGPGTGKTAIVVALLRTAMRLGVAPNQIALAAPTGKAAQRLTESIAAGLASLAAGSDEDRQLAARMPVAKTIHRMLRYSPRSGRFGHHRNHPISAQLVIIDEASMIDLELMDAIGSAVGASAGLVLLGDANQLPSVEAGAVLRELVLCGSAAISPTARPFAAVLTHSFRMHAGDAGGRAVLSASDAVRRGVTRGLTRRQTRAGDDDATFATAASADALRGLGAEHLEIGSGAAASAFAQWWYARLRATEAGFDGLVSRVYTARGGRFADADVERIERVFAAYERARLLTATRRGESGCEDINRALHRRVLAKTALSGEVGFYPGEPILMRQNDYQRDLFNGEHGVVFRVREAHRGGGHRFCAVFRDRAGGFRAFGLEALRSSVDLAFAITVHQSQGSEADSVALILPPSDRPLLTRELVYTGITRARSWAVVVGARVVLRAAVARGTERFSGVAAGLAGLAAAGVLR